MADSAACVCNRPAMHNLETEKHWLCHVYDVCLTAASLGVDVVNMFSNQSDFYFLLFHKMRGR